MSEYSAENIKVLDDISHIRLRAGMYVGEANNPHQLLSEIFDNAIDEVQAGYSPELLVTVDTKENRYTVRDWGRGIPHGLKTLENGEQKEVLEVLMTKSNSGGKFDNSSYNYSSGLNGLGLTITNALSKEMQITSYRGGKYVRVEARAAREIKLTKGNSKEPDGTEVIFIPDETMFKSEKIPVDFILNRCRIASALGFKARLIVDGIEQDTFSNIFDLITEEDSSVVTYTDIPEITVSNDAGELLKVALRYTSDTKDRYFGYTNLLSNYLGGTHIQALTKSISNVWQTLIGKYKNLKPTVELKPSDYLIGLRGICAVFISKPEFSSQTKEKLVVNKAYFEPLMTKFEVALVKYLTDNITVAQQLLKRFEEYRVAQNALLSRKEISSLIKVNEESSENIRRRSVVSKLRECTSKKRDGTELFIVEGDSACVRGDTKIRLANDTEATIKEVCERVASGETIYVYGKQPAPAKYEGLNIYKVLGGGVTRRNALLYRVYFDNDTSVDCTADHKFMLRNRTFRQAIDLTSQDLLSGITKGKVKQDINHRITKIECLNIYEDVYDIEVDDIHNYCLANDVIVHNCGPYLYVRDIEHQAVLPIRGKILNTTYKNIKEVIQNKEICDIANSIGCGIGAQCDASKSRYERVIISADADADGLHINCLVLAVFINLFPDMVKAGRVYISLPPLYCWGDSPANFGSCDRVEEIPKTAKNVERMKGLGQMNTNQLKYYLVDKNTRKLMQVEYPSDIDEFNKILGTSEGKTLLLKDLGIIISEAKTIVNEAATESAAAQVTGTSEYITAKVGAGQQEPTQGADVKSNIKERAPSSKKTGKPTITYLFNNLS